MIQPNLEIYGLDLILKFYMTINMLQAQDRGTKLYDAYCKFLLSYNDLSAEEKSKLQSQVKAERMKVKREDQEEDCIVKVTDTWHCLLWQFILVLEYIFICVTLWLW